MFDTFLIITFFLLASVLVCLLTLRLSINIKHCLIFHSLPILTNFLKFQPPVYFDPSPRLLGTLGYRKNYSIFCPPVGVKYLFFQAPAHGL